MNQQVLAFSIAGQPCALALEWVREVRAMGELLPLPLARPDLLGVVQLRGRMLPVLDLRALLGIAEAHGDAKCLLVIGRDAPTLGVAAGAVHGVRASAPDGARLVDGERLLAAHLGDTEHEQDQRSA